MKIFNRNFFLGLGAGVVLVIILEIVAALLFAAYLNWKHPMEERYASMLPPPPLPGLQSGSEKEKLRESAGTADYDWKVQSLDGADFDMSAAKGKPVFLNFWATWCPPCRIEMPSIQKLYDHLKDQGVTFLCISNEEKKIVSQFLRKKKYSLPIYIMKGEPPKIFSSDGVPATFVISPDGNIVLKHVGAAKWDDPSVSQFLLDLKKKEAQ